MQRGLDSLEMRREPPLKGVPYPVQIGAEALLTPFMPKKEGNARELRLACPLQSADFGPRGLHTQIARMNRTMEL